MAEVGIHQNLQESPRQEHYALWGPVSTFGGLGTQPLLRRTPTMTLRLHMV